MPYAASVSTPLLPSSLVFLHPRGQTLSHQLPPSAFLESFAKRQAHGMLAASQHTAVIHHWMEVAGTALSAVDWLVPASLASRAYQNAPTLVRELLIHGQPGDGLQRVQYTAMPEEARKPAWRTWRAWLDVCVKRATEHQLREEVADVSVAEADQERCPPTSTLSASWTGNGRSTSTAGRSGRVQVDNEVLGFGSTADDDGAPPCHRVTPVQRLPRPLRRPFPPGL
ncbi:hypothetical protein ABPG77_002118 [Micractinium sp. CCAP 211/92]